MHSRVASAPGRVNLIGDHTDYTGGLALPAALPWRTEVRAIPKDGEVSVETSLNGTQRSDRVGLFDDADSCPPHLKLAQFLAQRIGQGFALSVTSNVPVGAGLSSSAAYAVAVALALGAEGDPWALARLCQQAEAAAGANVGLLDQIAALCATKGHAVLIDFTDETTTDIALPEGTEIIIVDSGERRSLAESAYAERRASCEAASKVIGPLAFASLDALEELSDLDVRRRARHVLTENQRVREAALAATAGDAKTFGALMSESHASLSEDFSVSTPGIDALVELVQSTRGVYGTRITGGGFGGCVVALAARGTAALLRVGATTWVVDPSPGASRADEDPVTSR